MPHLDSTYFLSQFFWCFSIFLLSYFTVGKYFWAKYETIINDRKSKIHTYISKGEKILRKVSDIEEEMHKHKKLLIYEIKMLEEEAKKKILNTKKLHLKRLAKEIANRNLAHEIYLKDIKNEILLDLKNYSKDIDKKLTSYLF